jgi:hypothetical protein
MTTHNVYNFKKKNLKRKINIQRIAGIITGFKNPKELVLHIPSEYDYRYLLQDRDYFIDLLKE